MKKMLLIVIVCFFSLGFFYSNSYAVPVLQLYINEGTYDNETETWVINTSPFELWVIGNVSQFGTIYDVKLIAAYPTVESGNITFFPEITPIINGSGDPPSPVPPHAPYGSETSWNTYSLGDFTETNTQIEDMVDGGSSYGQINKYTVNVTGYSWVHFDVYDSIVLPSGKTQAKFAPPSHDSEYQVPEPGILILLGIGMTAVGIGSRWMRRK